jgi:hypothetical protein
VHAGVFWPQNLDTIFSMIRRAHRGLHKKRAGTRLNLCFCIQWVLRVTKFVLVRPNRETSTHYFSCSCGKGTDSTKARRDKLRQTCVFASGGICGSPSAFRCIWAVKCQFTIFPASVGLVRIPQNARRDTLRRSCIFASGGICGSCSSLR